MRSAVRPAENAGMKLTLEAWRFLHASMVNWAMASVVIYAGTAVLGIDVRAAIVIAALCMAAVYTLHRYWHQRLDADLVEQP